ncbi:uncharacterized protein LTR77_010122 [Saxophila tyrrhenica]|uniref:Uncharacterized protein n=1 Tax=Saxophila tyrrhenica TaxID=1690608 RepID=A0AAV9NW83_9PEZI|nr:hypothetical protein LTR77_010122 [Saxophila tyrrhenica]
MADLSDLQSILASVAAYEAGYRARLVGHNTVELPAGVAARLHEHSKWATFSFLHLQLQGLQSIRPSRHGPAFLRLSDITTAMSTKTSTMNGDVAIPQPPPRLLVGNIGDIDAENRLASINNLFKLHGPIFKLDLGGKTVIFVGGHELADELCDDSRFEKTVAGPLFEVRNVAGLGVLIDP